MGYWFALPGEYERLDAAHPMIGLELRAETLMARVGEADGAGAGRGAVAPRGDGRPQPGATRRSS